MPAALPLNIFWRLCAGRRKRSKIEKSQKSTVQQPDLVRWTVLRFVDCSFQFPPTWRRYIAAKLCGWCRTTRTLAPIGLSAKERGRGFHVLPTLSIPPARSLKVSGVLRGEGGSVWPVVARRMKAPVALSSPSGILRRRRYLNFSFQSPPLAGAGQSPASSP